MNIPQDAQDRGVAARAGTRIATTADAQEPLLAVRDLAVHLERRGQRIRLVSGLSYDVFPRTTLALIGESGSGKSTSCRAILGLLPDGAVASGRVQYDGAELLGLTERQMRRVRGRGIGMVFQDAHRALNPTMPIGQQIGESIRLHEPVSRKGAQRRVLELLHLLGFPAPGRIFGAYPHELSGGMRQRAVIGVALAAQPKLLIADEPTSALDVSTGAGIIRLLSDLQRQLKMAVILVSHDLRLVSNVADSVVVMREGEVAEQGPASHLMAHPRSGYTRALLDSIPRFESRPAQRERRRTTPLLRVRGMAQEFSSYRLFRARRVVRPISNVSFDLMRGEILGVVGETGAGKTTLVRAVLQSPAPSAGSVFFRGEDLTQVRGRHLRELRREIQMVFQDPFASLDPAWRVSQIVEEPLLHRQHGDRRRRRDRVAEVLDLVGLPLAAYGHRRPGQLSGGECQRVAIARALAPQPKIVVCDEALSSLDAIAQKQVAELFRRLRAELDVAFLFISHDLARVIEISDRIMLMYGGRICEIGHVQSLCRGPRHPYMAALLASPGGAAGAHAPAGSNDGAFASTSGCRYYGRCSRRQARCMSEEPGLREVAAEHMVACHFPLTPSGES